MIRGDLLIYTNNGIKRIDKLTKADNIYTNNFEYAEIDEIIKTNVKNYYVYKIKTFHNIDNYYLGGTNKIYCIQNIPYDLKIKDCPNYIQSNIRNCSPSFVNISNITEFDYIGFPYITEPQIEEPISDEDKYRFQGLVLLKQSVFNLNNTLNKNTIGFLNKYLHNNNIPFEIFNNNITTTIKFNLDDIQLLSMTEINNLTYSQIKILVKGFEELNSTITTTNKALFFQLKNIYFKIGILLSANYMNNSYIIKIPQNDNNYFIYDDYIWFKIKRIIRSPDKYTGQLMTLKLKNNDNYLSEIGVIS